MGNGETLRLKPVYVLDPWFVKSGKVGPNRWRFLLQSLEDLDSSLRKIGSRLYVVRGNPSDALDDLFHRWDVKKITWEDDTEPYAKERDAKIEKLAKDRKIEVVTCTSHTLYNPEQVIAKNKGETPLTYQKMLSLLASVGPPPKPVEMPEELSKEATLSAGRYRGGRTKNCWMPGLRL